MLAALTIVAMLMAMMPSTLRLGKRAWQTGKGGEETAAAATLDFACATGFRVHYLSSTAMGRADGNRIPWRPRSLRFISEVPAGPRGGGFIRDCLS